MYLSRRRRHQDGLAIIDVLLGMSIFALVVVISLQSFGHVKQRAALTQAISDAESVGGTITGSDEYIRNAQAAGRMVQLGGGGGLGRMATTARIVDIAEVLLSTEAEQDQSFQHVLDPVDYYELNLSGDNQLKDWKTSRAHFGFCIETPADAWAAYRSDKGGVYASGHEGGCPEVTFAGASTPVGPTPAADPAESPAPAPTSEPTPVVAEPVPEAAPWGEPGSAEEIEAMCAKYWGPQEIYGAYAVVYGTPGHDVFKASNKDQTFYGLAGDDLICGGNGKDTLYGGSGNDILMGGNGKDTLYGGTGQDFLHGNNGSDTMYVGDGFEDNAFGGNGPDVYLEDGSDGPTDEDSYVEAGPNRT